MAHVKCILPRTSSAQKVSFYSYSPIGCFEYAQFARFSNALAESDVSQVADYVNDVLQHLCTHASWFCLSTRLLMLTVHMYIHTYIHLQRTIGNAWMMKRC